MVTKINNINWCFFLYYDVTVSNTVYFYHKCHNKFFSIVPYFVICTQEFHLQWTVRKCWFYRSRKTFYNILHYLKVIPNPRVQYYIQNEAKGLWKVYTIKLPIFKLAFHNCVSCCNLLHDPEANVSYHERMENVVSCLSFKMTSYVILFTSPVGFPGHLLIELLWRYRINPVCLTFRLFLLYRILVFWDSNSWSSSRR